MQWWSLLALTDLYVINRPHTVSVEEPACMFHLTRVSEEEEEEGEEGGGGGGKPEFIQS